MTGQDHPVIPPAWRRELHPRRGGTPGPALRPDADAVRRLKAATDDDVLAALTQPQSDPDLAAEASAAFQNSDSADVTPLGIAAVGQAASRLVVRDHSADFSAWADDWVARYGVAFAAEAAVLMGGLVVGEAAELRPLAPQAYSPYWCSRCQDGVAKRVRAHLAVASNEEYAAAVERLRAYRNLPFRQREATSYLVPTETAWVDADWDECVAGRMISSRLLVSLASAEQLSRNPYPLSPAVDQIASLLDGLGAAMAPFLAPYLDPPRLTAKVAAVWVTAMLAIRTDEAFDLLVDRVHLPRVRPAVMEAMARYPERAMRRLEAAAARGAPVIDLLEAHAAAHPDLASPTTTAAPGPGETVPTELLPPLLVSPPWAQNRKPAKPAVVPGLAAPDEVAIEWAPGEREAWIATRGEFGMYGDWPPGVADRYWEEHAEAARNGNLAEDYHLPSLLALAPEHVGRRLLGSWRPGPQRYFEPWTQVIVGRYELDALPMALTLADHSPALYGRLLLPFVSGDVARLMADWLLRLKSLRPVANAWFERHPAFAARHLVPPAVGAAGETRRAAETALRYLASIGHADRVRDAARGYGPDALAAVEALLAVDPLDLLPAKVPTVPPWAHPALLAPVRLRHDHRPLPPSAVGHLCTVLALCQPGDVYAGVDVARAACEPADLTALAWELFERWLAATAPPKQSWAFEALGLFGDDETVRRLAPMIRRWPGETAHARAVAGLDVLAAIGTDVALMHLHGIAQRVPFKALKERAGEKIAEVAAGLGLTANQLADRLVPDLGVDETGGLTLDYGPRRFAITFDELLRPAVTDGAGQRLRDLPKPGAADDPGLAPVAYKQYSALKKDVRTLAGDQLHRLESAMVDQRRWTTAEFRSYLAGHPLLRHLVRRLVWGQFAGGAVVATFRVAEDGTLASENDDELSLDRSEDVGIVHPVQLDPASLAAWTGVFADYELIQPFLQLQRPVYRLTPEEAASERLDRFIGLTVPTTKVVGLERRGWRRAPAQDNGSQPWVHRVVPGNRAVVISLHPGIAIGDLGFLPDQQLTDIWLNPKPAGDWYRPPHASLPFGDLDDVSASEVLWDLADLTA